MSLLNFSLWVPCFRVPEGSPEEQKVVLRWFCSPLPSLSLKVWCWQKRENNFCGLVPSAALEGDEEPL